MTARAPRSCSKTSALPPLATALGALIALSAPTETEAQPRHVRRTARSTRRAVAQPSPPPTVAPPVTTVAQDAGTNGDGEGMSFSEPDPLPPPASEAPMPSDDHGVYAGSPMPTGPEPPSRGACACEMYQHTDATAYGSATAIVAAFLLTAHRRRAR